MKHAWVKILVEYGLGKRSNKSRTTWKCRHCGAECIGKKARGVLCLRKPISRADAYHRWEQINEAREES